MYTKNQLNKIFPVLVITALFQMFLVLSCVLTLIVLVFGSDTIGNLYNFVGVFLISTMYVINVNKLIEPIVTNPYYCAYFDSLCDKNK
jgi:hypothetical protein